MATAKKALALLLAGVILFLPNLAHARGCGCFFNHHVVPVAPAVVVVAPVYQVGTALEMRAEAVKAMRDYGILPPGTQPVKEDHHVQNTRQGPQDYGGQRPAQPIASPNGDLKSLAPVLWAKCWSCHSGNGSGVNHWNFGEGITGDQFLRITDMVANKANVPDKMKTVISGIKPEEYGRILDEAIKVAKTTRTGTGLPTPPQKTEEEDYRF